MKVLVLSSGNSVRSQMAEGWLKYYGRGKIDVKSAGMYENKGLNALAHHLMTVDAVVDISGQSSDRIDSVENENFDWLILLHDLPKESFKKIHAKQIIEFFLPDPLTLGLEGDNLVKAFVDIRNKIDDFCFSFVDAYIKPLIPRTDTYD